MKKQDAASLFNMNRVREPEQKQVMERSIADGVCPFCEEHLEKYHPKPVLFKTKYWIVTENAWPYPLSKNHLLLIYRPKHISHSRDIEGDGWKDFKEIIERLEKEVGLGYGTFFMRFGDMQATGATVKHIHAQIVQSDPTHKDYDPKKGLWTRIG